jgi:S1-C subfamily serine protease
VTLSLRVRSGALGGQGYDFRQDRVRVGRGAGVDLRLDPDRDLAVSAEHAEFYFEANEWLVRDLGSRNGTWIDGSRIEAPRRVVPGMRIAFGADGPVVEVLAEPFSAVQMSAEVRRQTRRLRSAVALLGVTLLLVVGGLVVHGRRQAAAWEQERRQLLAAADSVLRVSDAAPAPPVVSTSSSVADTPSQADAAVLAAALERSRAEVSSLRQALDRRVPGTEPQGRDEVELRRQLQTATTALRRQQLASSLDFQSIQAANGGAVALLYVEYPNGEVATGTGFAVRQDGLLLTVRHLVLPEPGGPTPTRIGVQFANSAQVFPARLVATSTEDDLAAVMVLNVAGSVPTVKGLNSRVDTLGTGAPVASIGFPLGGDTGGGVARSLVTAGLLSRSGPARLELHGYGEVGASGSPVFDANGQVVGVLFGGRPGDQDTDRVLLAVSAQRASNFLSRIR